MIFMEQIKKLPLNTCLYSNIYLESAIFMSIIMTKNNSYDWLLLNLPLQFVRVYIKGDLIYNDSYIKVLDHSLSYENINKYISILPYSDTELITVKQIYNNITEGLYTVVDLDEFYIPDTYYYKRVHYFRKFLICGFNYSSSVFYAYSHDKFTKFKEFSIHKNLLENVILKSLSNIDAANKNEYKAYVLSLNRDVNFKEFTAEAAYESLKSLKENKTEFKIIKSCIISEDIYGSKKYDILIRGMNDYMRNLEKLDFRFLGMLAYNKKIISDFLFKLNEFYKSARLEKISSDFSEMSKLFERFMMKMLIARNYSDKYSVMSEITEFLKSTGENEEKLVNEVFLYLG